MSAWCWVRNWPEQSPITSSMSVTLGSVESKRPSNPSFFLAIWDWVGLATVVSADSVISNLQLMVFNVILVFL